MKSSTVSKITLPNGTTIPRLGFWDPRGPAEPGGQRR